jgi:hypothetical protein
MYLFQNRQLSSTLGRWATLDPSAFEAGDYDLYRYLANNPTNEFDPTGLDMNFSPNGPNRRLPPWEGDVPTPKPQRKGIPACCSGENIRWNGHWNFTSFDVFFVNVIEAEFSFFGTDDKHCVYTISGDGASPDAAPGPLGFGYFTLSFSVKNYKASLWPITKDSRLNAAIMGIGGTVGVPVSLSYTVGGSAGQFKDSVGLHNINFQGGLNIFVGFILFAVDVSGKDLKTSITVPADGAMRPPAPIKNGGNPYA